MINLDIILKFYTFLKECWIDPMSLNPTKAVETIGNTLQRQYERWQPRARYRLSLDPTYDEVKRLAINLRKSARDERVLFHYNGHGVSQVLLTDIKLQK